jgi:uncharacterized damage-inducible protein DinB
MDAIATLSRLLEHAAWADVETLAALERASHNEPARKLLAHVVATEFLWLDRLQGTSQRHPVWPDWSLEEIGTRQAELPGAWRAFLGDCGAAGLLREVSYVNSRGERWSSTVHDVVAHVALHGAHHRGQIAAELRRAGLEPPYVDFVHAARTGQI